VAKISVTAAVLIEEPQRIHVAEVLADPAVRFDGVSSGGTMEGVAQ
jgi:hypothetical protein